MKAAAFALGQKMPDVNREVIVAIHRVGGPVTEASVATLTTRELIHGIGDCLLGFCLVDAEVGVVLQHNPRPRPTRDLLGAAVGIFLQVGRQAVGQTERSGGDDSLPFGKFPEHGMIHGHVMGAIPKPSALDLCGPGDSGPNAKGTARDLSAFATRGSEF